MSQQPIESDENWETPAAASLQVLDDDGIPDVFDVVEPLTTDEARHLTDNIRTTAGLLFTLLARAHKGRAWVALGYSTFADYVHEEFDMSRSRAYQILDQATVVAAIEEATPDGTPLAITEAAARDLKTILGDVVPDIAERTEGLPPEEAGHIVDEMIGNYRDQVRDKREQDALDREEAAMDAADRAGFSGSGGNPSGGGSYVPPPDDVYDDDPEDTGLDAAQVRQRIAAAYDLYTTLTVLKGMPEPDSLISVIPVERRMQINDAIEASLGWLAEFRDQWKAQPWQAGADQEDESEEEDEEL